MKEGDQVQEGDTIAIVETAEASNEIPAPHDGVIEKFYCKQNETIEVGAHFYRIKLDSDEKSKRADLGEDIESVELTAESQDKEDYVVQEDADSGANMESYEAPAVSSTMTEVILFPTLSSTMTEGIVAEWLVEEGDMVHQGDGIAVIESDKATMEVEAAYDGVIDKLYYQQNETIEVGATFYSIKLDLNKKSK